MDNSEFNGDVLGAELPNVDSSRLKGQYPVTFKGIGMFERAFEYLKIEVIALENDAEYEERKLKDNRGLPHSIRTPSIKPLKPWVWLLYKPTEDSD